VAVEVSHALAAGGLREPDLLAQLGERDSCMLFHEAHDLAVDFFHWAHAHSAGTAAAIVLWHRPCSGHCSTRRGENSPLAPVARQRNACLQSLQDGCGRKQAMSGKRPNETRLRELLTRLRERLGQARSVDADARKHLS